MELLFRQAARGATAYDERVFVREVPLRAVHTHMNTHPSVRRYCAVPPRSSSYSAVLAARCLKNEMRPGRAARQVSMTPRRPRRRSSISAASYAAARRSISLKPPNPRRQQEHSIGFGADGHDRSECARVRAPQANLQNAASAAQAQLGKAASLTGEEPGKRGAQAAAVVGAKLGFVDERSGFVVRFGLRRRCAKADG